MKRLALSTLIIVISLGFANAQSFHLGIKGGANLTKMDGQSFNQQFKFGYQLGGFAEINFSKSLGIQPEVLFSQSQTQVASNSSAVVNGLHGNENINLDYLSIPLLLRINTGKLLTFVVGPQYSIIVNNHQTTLQNGQNAFKSGDFAVVGGLQLNLNALRIYGRYVIGLNNINDVTNQDNWKSQQIQLGVGLRIL
jgi:hypothetical protein